MTIDRVIITKGQRDLFLAAAVVTYLLVAVGVVVCATDSSQGCPDWPGCYGKLFPPLRMDSIIEYTHRLIAALATLIIVAAVMVSWCKLRSIRWISWPLAGALVFLFVVSAFGAFAVLRGLSPGYAAIDLGSALLVLALVLVAAVTACSRYANPALPDRLSFGSSFARLGVGTLVVMFVVLVSGVLVAKEGSAVRCLGGPLYDVPLFPLDSLAWPGLIRLLLAGLFGVLIAVVVVQAWRTQREREAILRSATILGALFLVEMVVGTLLLMGASSLVLQVTSVATTAGLWAVLVVLVGLAVRSPAGR